MATRAEMSAERSKRAEMAAKANLRRLENTCRDLRLQGFRYGNVLSLQEDFKKLMGTLNRSTLIRF